ncbi:hypothetical protein AB2B38_007705 [Balneola sp. MJW-20]|uniref:hypothetical protein n=1 Tax=Gracilimonas aurantiaca TaxID=3234185 RepID=UPI003467D933
MDISRFYRQLTTYHCHSAVLFLLVVMLSFTNSAHAQKAVPDPDSTERDSVTYPLFYEDEPLELWLEMDLRKVLNDRGDDPDYHPLTVRLTDPFSGPLVLDARVKVRGNFRKQRDNCPFPPLRLNFKKDQLEGTVFDGQDKLKLVTHCRTNRAFYEQFLLQEYLVYKMYNQLTEKSFRVRLLKITYEDSRGRSEPFSRYGFLIEDEDLLAERLGGRILEVNNVHPDRTDKELSSLLPLFQFMIGNTDWSIPGLHNIKLVIPEEGGTPTPIPYDFDMSGIVNTPYAEPPAILNIRSVTERVYRGFCQSPEEYQKAFAEFNGLKESIYKLYKDHSPPLEEDELRQSISYLDEFFEIINDERKSNREVIEACRSDR